MNKSVKYWVRRAIVSLPLYLFLVHEADTRRLDDGTRVFADHIPAVLWGVVFVLVWSSLDHVIAQTTTNKENNS